MPYTGCGSSISAFTQDSLAERLHHRWQAYMKLKMALVDEISHQASTHLRRPTTIILAGFILLCLAAAQIDTWAVQATRVLLAFSLAANAAFALVMWQLRREAKLRAEAEQTLALTLNTMRDGIVAFDAEQRLVVANRRYQEIYTLPDELIKPGTPFAHVIDALRECQPDIPPTQQFIKQFLARLQAGDTAPIIMRTQNAIVAVSYRARPGGGWVSTHEDVTERTEMERRLQHLALHDALTGLANRVLLYQRLEAALVASGTQRFAVLCLDLDRFKEVNDTLGHSAGDELLRQVALRLQSCLVPTDTAARMGGDEFAVIHLGSQPASLTALASRIINSVSSPYIIDGQNVVIGTSVGIAISPQDGSNADDLLKNGDLALYVAKKERRGTFRHFESWMERREQDRHRTRY
jgi:diguanylate cyclase (GGDEF)-like protein